MTQSHPKIIPKATPSRPKVKPKNMTLDWFWVAMAPFGLGSGPDESKWSQDPYGLLIGPYNPMATPNPPIFMFSDYYPTSGPIVCYCSLWLLLLLYEPGPCGPLVWGTWGGGFIPGAAQEFSRQPSNEKGAWCVLQDADMLIGVHASATAIASETGAV